MIRGQRVSAGPWTWSVDHLKAVRAETTEADGVAVVPCFHKEHDVDRLITANFQQVVQLVAERPNVQTAKYTYHDVRLSRIINVHCRVAVNNSTVNHHFPRISVLVVITEG